MSTPRSLVALAVLAFLLAFVARLPARWLPKLLPSGIVCIEPSGTFWDGACANFEAGGFRAGAIRWTLQPLRLLTGRLAARVRVSQPLATVEGVVALTPGGAVEARNLRGSLGLAPGGLLPGIPPDLEGRVALDLAELTLHDRVVGALAGRVEIQDLRQRTSEGMVALGGYELKFAGDAAADGKLTGQLRDTGGPLDVAGTLTLTPAPGYLLSGTVATRPEASPTLVRQIAFLGSPDAAGRRSFAQEASF